MRIGPLYGFLDAHQPLVAATPPVARVQRENLIDAALSAAAASTTLLGVGLFTGRVVGGVQVVRGCYQAAVGGFHMLGAALAGASASGNNAGASPHTVTAGALNVAQGIGNIISPEIMFPVNVGAAGKDGFDALLAPWSMRR